MRVRGQCRKGDGPNSPTTTTAFTLPSLPFPSLPLSLYTYSIWSRQSSSEQVRLPSLLTCPRHKLTPLSFAPFTRGLSLLALFPRPSSNPAGGIGQPLALLMKTNPLVTEVRS